LIFFVIVSVDAISIVTVTIHQRIMDLPVFSDLAPCDTASYNKLKSDFI
jgi:hypothetical protein